MGVVGLSFSLYWLGQRRESIYRRGLSDSELQHREQCM